MENKDQLPVVKPSKGTLKSNSQSKPEWTPKEKAMMAVVISQAFDMQKQFGKTTAQLENVVEGFCWVMAEYPIEKVVDGFTKYLRTNSDMPTPSDIVKIIDPKPSAFRPDAPYYISLKKIHKEQGPYGLTLEEIEYVGRYEQHMQKQMRDSVRDND